MSARKMRMLTITLILFLLVMSIYVHPVYCWGPHTHVSLTKEVLSSLENETSPILRIVRAHIDAFYCGLLIPDVSVIYYYTDFQVYKSTHSWSWYHKLIKVASSDEELAFAYGVACHLIQDAVIHNYYIPQKIRRTWLMNSIVHPIVEGLIETHHLTPETRGALSVMEQFLPLMNKTLRRDFTKEANTLRSAVAGGRFYQQAYTPDRSSPLWGFYQFISGFLQGWVDESDYQRYYQTAKQKTIEFFKYGTTPALDPSGEEALKGADGDVMIYSILLYGGGAVLLLVAARKGILTSLLKRRKKS